jgi:hypothetical protein
MNMTNSTKTTTQTIAASESEDRHSITFTFCGKTYTLPAYRNSVCRDTSPVVSMRVEVRGGGKYLQIASVNYESGPGVYSGQLIEL